MRVWIVFKEARYEGPVQIDSVYSSEFAARERVSRLEEDRITGSMYWVWAEEYEVQ